LSADSNHTLTVVAVSGGYPGSYVKGYEIEGLDQICDATVFHMGTASDQGTVTAGGRVLAVTAAGPTLTAARQKAYRQLSLISYRDMYYRPDIGEDLMNMKNE